MSTKSEELFETFLASNGVRFERIEEENGARRPDYLVDIGNRKIIFEVKQLGDDEYDNHARPNGVLSITPGAQIRQIITHSKKQIQYGAEQGIPSVLLVYNNTDPLQMNGTEEFDFTTAMYGEYTMLINRQQPQERTEVFHGRNDQMQASKNTSFSAVGYLCNRGRTTTVTLWENAYAKVKVPFEQLPPCFAVRRVEITRAAMRWHS